MRKVLSKDFFHNNNTRFVAKKLLGKFLVRKLNNKRCVAYMITDVEAYDGPLDKASHAHRGKTNRNSPMFGSASHWYVYFTYGIHWMLNIVTGDVDYPATILIRGVSEITGPARLTKRLKIDKRFNGLTASKKSKLWIEDRGVVIAPQSIKRSPRIGVAFAGEWATKPYRFYITY